MKKLKKIHMDVDGMFAAQTAWPIVHSSMKPGSSTLFYGTDNADDFKINQTRLPSEWMYNTTDISYNFNSAGLRMDKEISDVNSNYLIAFGCSHTLGVGVALKDSWPYLMAQELNMDYINSAVSGSSIKLNVINFFNMLSTVKELPKIVAIAWPSSVRYTWYSKEQFLFYLPRYATDKVEFKLQTQAYNDMLMTDLLTTESIFYRNMLKTTCNRLGIKFCETSFDPVCEFVSTLNITLADNSPLLKLIDSCYYSNSIDVEYLNNYFARDVRDLDNNCIFGHVGIKQHLNAKNILMEQL
jgi:hypothetical protein